MSVTAKVIAWLAPVLLQTQVNQYSQLVDRAALKYRFDPLFMVALIQAESRFSRYAKSRTNDYGLGQIHVSKTTNAHLLGREHLLYDAAYNIKLITKTLRLWKRYHEKRCGDHSHHWWSHYQWGRIVRNAVSGNRVRKLYLKLRGKFRAGK